MYLMKDNKPKSPGKDEDFNRIVKQLLATPPAPKKKSVKKKSKG